MLNGLAVEQFSSIESLNAGYLRRQPAKRGL